MKMMQFHNEVNINALPPSLYIGFIACAATLVYGVYHVVVGNRLLGCVAMLCCITMIFWVRSVAKSKPNIVVLTAFLLSLSTALLITSYEFGIRGLILIFPLIAGYYFVYIISVATVLSFLLCLLGLLLATNVHEPVFVIRVAVAYVICISFNGTFAYFLKERRDELQQQLSRDYLTGLHNRRGLSEWMERKVEAGLPERPTYLSIFFFDIDDFKHVNDNYGHQIGDQLIQAFGSRFAARFEKFGWTDAVFARISGDEFALAIDSGNEVLDVEAIAEAFLEEIRPGFTLYTGKILVQISIGVTQSLSNAHRSDELIHYADVALKHAKLAGKNRFQVFNDDMAQALVEQQVIEQALDESIAAESFYLLFMPIVDAKNDGLHAVEVLLRSDHKDLKHIDVEDFIDVAESRGLITPIDLWVFEHALIHIAKWQQTSSRQLYFSINISGFEIANSFYARLVAEFLEKMDISPEFIILEVTETAFVENSEAVINNLKALKQMGFLIALDDFGTGYMSFTQLEDYPVDKIKIDRSFIAQIDSSLSRHATVDILLDIGKLHELCVIAEGVETEYQAQYLKDHGCDFLQGYHYSKPLQWDDFLKYSQSN